METQFWSKVKEFHGVQIIRDPDTMQSRIIPVPQRKKQIAESFVITEEMRARAEESWRLHCMLRDAKPVTSLPIVKQVEPKPMTFEEQLEHDFRHSPALRKEFTSFGSYQAL